MKEIKYKILLVTDDHHQTVDFYKQKGQNKNGIFFLTKIYDLWKKNNEKSIELFYKKIEKKDYSFMIDLGDFSECLYSERGLVTENDFEITKSYKSVREIKLDFNEMYYLAGNHDLGYISEISRDKEGVISKKSIDYFQSLFVPLFYSFVKDNIRYIMFSSSLFIEDLSHIDDIDEKKYILNLKEKQKEFILEKFEDFDDFDRNFIFTHDPKAIKKLESIISEEKLKEVDQYFVGHLHSKIFIKYFNLVGMFFHTKAGRLLSKITNLGGVVVKSLNFYNSSYLFDKYNIKVVSAIGGLVGLDKGYGELVVYEDNSFEYYKHNI
ncbi:MAG: metallophosphoesterase [Candidatus Woesearchaeota archaeon]